MIYKRFLYIYGENIFLEYNSTEILDMYHEYVVKHYSGLTLRPRTALKREKESFGYAWFKLHIACKCLKAHIVNEFKQIFIRIMK